MAKKNSVFGMLAMVLTIGLMAVGCEQEAGDPAPPPPTEVRARALEGGQIQVTWDESPGASRYDIAYRTEFESESTRHSAGSAYVTSYTHRPSSNTTGNDPVSVYYVRSANRASPSHSGNQESAWSSGFEVGSVPWVSGQTPPQSLKAKKEDDGSVRITWNRLQGAVQYELQYSSTNNAPWSPIFTGRPSAEGGGSSMTQVHYPESSSAFYRVRASNTSVEVQWRIVTDWSQAVEATAE